MFTHKIKSFSVLSLFHFGFFDLLLWIQRQRIVILMYHRFSKNPEPFKITEKIFDRQLTYLNKKFSIISLNDYVSVLSGEKKSLPPNPLILTIDDGYQDNYHYAYPILKKHKTPATIFLTTDFINQRAWLWSNKLEYILKNSRLKKFTFPIAGIEQPFNVGTFQEWHRSQLGIFNYCRLINNKDRETLLDELASYLHVKVSEVVTDEFSPLTWDQIRLMQAHGIEYGSHTCSHPICSKLAPDELYHELEDSKKEIEKQIDAQVDLFCYPNGQPNDISDDVVQQLKKSGYKAAVTTFTGYNSKNETDHFRLKRMSFSKANYSELLRELTRIQVKTSK